MEVFEAIVNEDFVIPILGYMQATADAETPMPDVCHLVDIAETGVSEEQADYCYGLLMDLGFDEETLRAGVCVSALGLLCMVGEPSSVVDAILYHNVYYKLGLVPREGMALVCCGEGGESNEVDSVDMILRARELDDIADLQKSIYNNFPPF